MGHQVIDGLESDTVVLGLAHDRPARVAVGEPIVHHCHALLEEEGVYVLQCGFLTAVAKPPAGDPAPYLTPQF